MLMFTTFGILSVSLIGQSLSPLFSKSFYARQNTIIPVMVNLCAIALDVILALVLGKRFGLIGIASGFAIACTVDAMLMYILLRWHLHKDNVELGEFDYDVGQFIFKILVSTVVMGLVGYCAIYAFAPLVNTQTTIGIMVQSGLAVTFAVFSFLVVSYAMGIRQSRQLVAALEKYF